MYNVVFLLKTKLLCGRKRMLQKFKSFYLCSYRHKSTQRLKAWGTSEAPLPIPHFVYLTCRPICLKMETACSSETLLQNQKTTQRNNSSDHFINSHSHENINVTNLARSHQTKFKRSLKNNVRKCKLLVALCNAT
jgi:hypothetical protein